ncbi:MULTISPECIES: twin-arginine translocation signal domain-containing protein [Streptomyces]|uniref:Twin-arginine translocation signal domain-containing protein n=1 Tax=Streptomyces morookaense TaxID=1970 RepID=A0A7Y7B8T5_STRMO|nr:MULTISPECIES: twin-arginine translocation signal domain-containing protein [Streptomyces]MCC2279788.1 twin-arginine translocation signal domain-containing protein [Streptomyces sp. ET3-23]NVK81148.1 twin-arginine translocation signal domain-containing protein [Streptomyces morookaense]
MSGISRRDLLGWGAVAAVAPVVAGCTAGTPDGPAAKPSTRAKPRRIGDGSAAVVAEQPNQPPPPEQLEPGEKPPQFVVFSWDGAGEVGNGLFPRFRELARNHGARMTFFLSGIYCLPEDRRHAYRPPNNPRGASDIGYLSDEHVKETLRNIRAAWLEGHEIGTHFNGHFCSGRGSVAHWEPEDWEWEIEQAVSFVTEWRTHTGFTDVEPLPFDYREELVGGRTPCLLNQENLLPVARKLGWRYDASNPGGEQIWPRKRHGIWDLPLQQIPFPGHSFEVLSMDYNILANQSKNALHGRTDHYPHWRQQATDSFIAGFERAYETNRAPYFIGNHFEDWNGGIYMDAVEEALKHIADERHKDVRLVSFRQFVDWLDVQDPKVMKHLRTLEVGEKWSPAGR